MSKQQFDFLTKIGAAKLIDYRITVTESYIQPTPNPNNSTIKYDKINLNYCQAELGNVCPQLKSNKSPRTSFGNKIRIFTDNMYI